VINAFETKLTNSPNSEVKSMRRLIEEYFEAWETGIAEQVLNYFSDDVVVELTGQGMSLAGKDMVAKHWIEPTLKSFPRNRHSIKKFVESDAQVVIEWDFIASHARSGKEIHVAGRSVYFVKENLIRRGEVFFENAQDQQKKSQVHPTALPRAS